MGFSKIQNVQYKNKRKVWNLRAGEDMERSKEKALIQWGLEEWETQGSVTIMDSGGHDSGSYFLMGSSASVEKTVSGLIQGSYTLSLWVKGKANGTNVKMRAQNTGGPDAATILDLFMDENEWQQVGHRNILVYNGQAEIRIETNSNANGIQIGAIELSLDVDDENPVKNWGFTEGLENWNTTGVVSLSAVEADTGEQAVQLGADSEIYQNIPVQPNTRYIAVMRGKVAIQDTYRTVPQYSEDHGYKMGEIVERISLGHRINIGVRSVDGQVLRQAPSGTKDYSLVTVAFTTGSANTEVTLYANTKNDEVYRESVTVHQGGIEEPSDEWDGNGGDYVYADNFHVFPLYDEYVKGADVSFLPLLEDIGGKFFANGVQQDCLRIISNHGVNSIISMVHVHAGNSVYDPVKLTEELVEIKDFTYPRKLQEGYFDKIHTVELASRAMELGMSYLPGFQFSDVWMSSSKAYTPYDWIIKDYEGNLSNESLELIKTAVYNYSYDFLTALKEAGCHIIGIKHGNEQNGGIVWPAGQGATSSGHVALINASVAAAREVFPGVANYVHSNNGYSPDNTNSFFGGLIDNGAEMDGMAYSLYGGRYSSEMFKILANNMNDSRFKYKDYLNVETGFSFTSYNPTPDFAVSSTLRQSYYSTSGNGQYNWLLDYLQAPLDIPNPNLQKRGSYYWETDWLPVMGAGTGIGRVNDISGRIMFNNGDTSITEMGSTESGKSGDMMDSMYAYLIRTQPKDKAEAMLTPLKDAGSYIVEQKEVESISFAQDEINLVVGGIERIRPIAEPIDYVHDDSRIKWGSDNTDVAQVSDSGFVYAVGAGNARISGTIGQMTAELAVTVEAGIIAGNEDLKIDIDGQTISNGATIHADALDSIQITSSLSEDVTNRSVILRAENPEIASFFGESWQTTKGELRQNTAQAAYVKLNIIAAGETTIIVSTADGGASIYFRLVAEKVPVTSIAIESGECSVANGKTMQLHSKVLPENATFYKITWQSIDDRIASVDENGLVTGNYPGTTVIRALSQDNGEIYDECTVEVTYVEVESVFLDKAKVNLLVDQEMKLNALVIPDNAVEQKIVWEADVDSYISVAADGTIRGISQGGPTVVTASAENVTATCEVMVLVFVTEPVQLEITPAVHYFKSDYYAEVNPLETPPYTQLIASILPENAAAQEINWSSDPQEIAAIDQFGCATAGQSGVATIYVSDNYSNKGTAAVYVPSISESFENREDKDDWGMEVPDTSAGGLAAAVQEGRLCISGGGNGSGSLQKVIEPIENEKIIMDVTWNIGTAAGNAKRRISMEDSRGNCYAALQANEEGVLTFGTADPDKEAELLNETSVGAGFTGNNVSYQIQVILDFSMNAYSVTIAKAEETDTSVQFQNRAFSSVYTYENDFSIFNVSVIGEGNTDLLMWIESFHVYAGAPVPVGISIDTEKIKLVPIKDTLSVAYKLKASVLPSLANQQIEWKSSDTAIALVDQMGLVTAAKQVDTLEEIESGACKITAVSKSNSEVYAEVSVTVGVPSNSAEYLDIYDETGKNVVGETLQMVTGDIIILTGRAYGVDGDTELASLDWISSDEQIIRYIEQENPLEVLVRAIGSGTAALTLQVDGYGNERTAEIAFSVAGDRVIYLTELHSLLETAQTALTYPDDYYTEESISDFRAALENAGDIYDQAIDESWEAERQSEIDQASHTLDEAIRNLRKRDYIAVTDLLAVIPNYPVSVGKEFSLNVEIIPEYATNQKLIFSYDTATVTISQDGQVTVLQGGNIEILIEIEGEERGVTLNLETTDDVFSWYDRQGGEVSATATSSSQYDPSYPLVNARNMNYRDTAWTPGTTTSSTWTLDLGAAAQIQELYFASWAQQSYVLSFSEDGENYTDVVDKRDRLYGEAFDAVRPSDGTVGIRYRFQDTFENTVARFIQVKIRGVASGNYVSMEVFQAKGKY